MIERLTISNYRSLGDKVDVRLGPLTALVGQNGSGKSNVLDCLQFLSDIMRLGLPGALTNRHGIAAVRRWSGGHPRNVALAVEVRFAEYKAFYEFELKGDRINEYLVKRESALIIERTGVETRFLIEDGEWKAGAEGLRPPVDNGSLALPLVGGDARFKPLVDYFKGIAVYSIFPDTLKRPQPYNPTKPMSRQGENWLSILKDLPVERWKSEMIEGLARLTGDIIDLKVEHAAVHLIASFLHDAPKKPKQGQKRFESNQESDGTLRFAGILAALLQHPPPPVVGIEEPELTIHPGALPLLLGYIRQASKNSQVVVATHSPELVDLLDADEIRVVGRRDGATVIGEISEVQREEVKAGLRGLGELLAANELRAEQLSFLPMLDNEP